MYKNLKAEMLKQEVELQSIADALEVKLETARKKVNGMLGISLEESFKIASLFKNDNTIEYLFAKSGKEQ